LESLANMFNVIFKVPVASFMFLKCKNKEWRIEGIVEHTKVLVSNSLDDGS
jgi:hypothetical protein